MGNMLSSFFARLGKSRVFWVCAALAAALALLRGGWEFRVGPDQLAQDRWEAVLLYPIQYELPCMLAVLAALFLGGEYAGGALRNKLIVGRPRWAVYASALLTVTAASALLLLLCTGVTAVLCLLAHGPMPDPSRVPAYLAAALLVCAAWSALFTAVGLNCARPAVSAAVCLAAVGVTFVACTRFFVPDILLHGGGPEAALSRFFYDLLPMGQGDQLRFMRRSSLSDPPEVLMACSALFTALTTAGGLALFRRRDLQ